MLDALPCDCKLQWWRAPRVGWLTLAALKLLLIGWGAVLTLRGAERFGPIRHAASKIQRTSGETRETR